MAMLCNVADHKVVTQKSVVASYIWKIAYATYSFTFLCEVYQFLVQWQAEIQMPHYMECVITGPVTLLSGIETCYPHSSWAANLDDGCLA